MSLQQISIYCGYIAVIIGAISAICVPMSKAIKNLQKPILEIKAENAAQTKKLDALSDDVARLSGDRLNQAYDYYVAQGWCPSAKKRQLQDWYNAYKGAGYNHLADHYLDTIITLPQHPKERKYEQ